MASLITIFGNEATLFLKCKSADLSPCKRLIQSVLFARYWQNEYNVHFSKVI